MSMSGRKVADRHGEARRRASPGTHRAGTASLMVEELFGSALLQDLGRGHVASGVPVAGAFDRRAHRLALDLVGTASQEATLELWGSMTVRAEGSTLVATTGAAAVELQRAPRWPAEDPDDSSRGWEPVPAWTALELAAGDALRLTATGRAYLAVRGGFPGRTVLGSRSTCLMGPLGPDPVTRGHVLQIGDATQGDPRAGDYIRVPARGGAHRVVAGPPLVLGHVDADVVETSRIGVRLRPRRSDAAWSATSDLPSIGVLPGTIQVLPSGDWMVLGPDAGTMGGYPVVGVLAGDELDRWAHVQPGDLVGLVGVSAGSVRVPPLERVVHVGQIG